MYQPEQNYMPMLRLLSTFQRRKNNMWWSNCSVRRFPLVLMNKLLRHRSSMCLEHIQYTSPKLGSDCSNLKTVFVKTVNNVAAET